MRLTKHDKYWTYEAADLADFIQTVKERTTARPGSCWNDSSVRGREGFTKTESLEHAVQMLTAGWPEGAAQILKGQADVAASGGLPDLTPSFEWDIGGEYPDVGAYCAGVPEHMASPAPFNNQVASVIRIAVPGSIPHTIKADEIVRYGVALMSVIDSIQESGRSVALFWEAGMGMCDDPEGKTRPLYTTVPLTTPGAPVDVSRLAFAFHPSMLRRCWFAVCEVEPDLSALGTVYGLARDRRKENEREPGTIYPRGPWAMSDRDELRNVAGAVRALSADINSQIFGEQDQDQAQAA